MLRVPPNPTKPPRTAPSTGLPPLRVADRCDRCGSRAYVAACFGDWPTPLLFCSHHFREWEAAIRAAAVQLRDDREILAADVKAAKVPGGV